MIRLRAGSAHGVLQLRPRRTEPAGLLIVCLTAVNFLRLV